MALIAEHYHERRVEMMGFALMGSTAGSLLGPIIGGSLCDAGGYTLPFAVTGILVDVDAGLCVFLLPRDQGGREANSEIRSLLLDKSVLMAAAAVALAAIGWGIIEPLLPLQLIHTGVSPGMIGVIFTAGSIAYGLSPPVVGWVSNWMPIRRLIAGGTAPWRLRFPSSAWATARSPPRSAYARSASATPYARPDIGRAGQCGRQAGDVLLCRRLRRLQYRLRGGPDERVIASSDCGLGGRVHLDIAWAKLDALAQGAALVSRQLWR